jgi:type IV secretion system protein VirB10
MLKPFTLFCLFSGAAAIAGQFQAAPPVQAPVATAQQAPQTNGLKERQAAPPGEFRVNSGTHLLLSMVNSVSTKQAAAGDRIYLQTAFPIVSNGQIVIPQGSWVTGTITQVKRPGRIKGRGSLQVRFDSLVLPNGVSRSFRADLGALDARNGGTLNREQSKVKGPGDKKSDAGEVVTTTAEGAAIGTAVGAASGHLGGGSVIGLGAGAAAGLIGVLASRGPDATLDRGSTVEMVLDRPLSFSRADLDFAGAPAAAALPEGTPRTTTTPPGWLGRTPF